MLNLKVHSTISDLISISYEGPGFYSSKCKKPLENEIILEKVSEEYMDKEDVYQFCKLEGYRIKPYLVKSMDDIPSHWEIVQYKDEIDYEENY